MRYRMHIFFYLAQRAQRFKLCQQFLAPLKPVQPLIGRRDIFIECCILVKNIQQLQLMAFAYLKVIEIMGRRDFYRPCAFFHIRIFIGNDRNSASSNRQHNLFAYQMGVARIFRMDGNRHIAKHGFRPGSGNGNNLIAIYYRIMQLPHPPVNFALFHFQIRNGG